MARPKRHTISLTPAAASAIVAVGTSTDLVGTILSTEVSLPNDLARTIIVTTSDGSATASATTTFAITGTDLWGNTTTDTIISLGSSTANAGSVYFKSVTQIVRSTATTTNFAYEVGYTNLIRTDWIPVDHHNEDPITFAIALGGSAGDANILVERTYSSIRSIQSALAFSSATISATSTEVTYTHPFTGYRLSCNGSISQTIDVWVYRSGHTGE